MAEQENEESAHLRPACVACTYHCNKIHGDRDFEEEKFDPDRSWPFFRKKVSKLSVHHAPQSAICIPPAFIADYPDTFQKGRFTTLEGPSGNTWRVAVVDRSVLHLGWRAFAHDHRLREGDVLNFTLTKPSHFVVDVFNGNGDVRRSARNARVTGMYSVAPGTPALQVRCRKRKEMETGVRTIADQRKPTTKRGHLNNVDYTMGPRLKFCEKTKQWKSHEKRGGREVVNLDSDDEEPKGQVKRREPSSRIGRLVEFMREEQEENGILPEPTPPVIQVVNLEGEDHEDIITGHGEENCVAHEQQEDDDYRLDEEQDLIASNPLRQFTTMFDTRPRKSKEDLTAEIPAIEVKKINLGLKRQAQVPCDLEDMVRIKEEEDDAHANSSQITLPTTASAMPEMYESKLSALSSVPTDVKLAIVNSSRIQGKVQEAGEFSFENKANIPVTDTTHEGGRDSAHPLKGLISQELATELDTLKLKEDEILKHLTTSIDTAHQECMFQPTPHSAALKDCDELHVTKMEPEEDPITSPVSENAKENETLPSTNGMASQTRNEEITPAMTSGNILTPVPEEIELRLKPGNGADVQKETGLKEVDMVGHPKRKLEFKELISATTSDSEAASPGAAQVTEKNFNMQAKPTPMTKTEKFDTCVLISKRGRVAHADRDRALQSAQAWAKKLSNPYFIAVMKNTNVYTDFNMDIPAKFVKQSKMPSTEVRVTLVSEAPPTNCKAVWKPGCNEMENSRLNGNGWMNFSRTHFLEEGDVCVFEDLNKYPAFRIGVYIFRVVELKRPVVLDWERHYKVNPDQTIPSWGPDTHH